MKISGEEQKNVISAFAFIARIPVNSAVYFLSLPFLIVGLLFLITALFKWLWNITIPKLLPIREITYWEAFRLLIIAWILFGGFQWFF